MTVIPLILGLYGAFLGLGLAAIGLAGIGGGVGIVRLLIGLGMACFGLYGIWDGVRDSARPKEAGKSSCQAAYPYRYVREQEF